VVSAILILQLSLPSLLKPDASAVLLPVPHVQVVIKHAATVDLSVLQAYMAGEAMEEEVPRNAVQVLEVVMRSGVSGE
jgi:hypothetical protein